MIVDDEKEKRSSGHESSTYPSRVGAIITPDLKRINTADIVRRF